MNQFIYSNRFHYILKNIIFFFLIWMAWSCSDDLIYKNDDYPNDGNLHMTVAFEPLSGIETNTRTAGDEIKKLESLAIVFFDEDGNLFKIINQGDPEIVDGKITINQEGNTAFPDMTEEDKTNKGNQAEAKTPLASFALQNIPYGNYKIYAVANMGIVTESMAADENTLKGQILEWKSDVKLNNQMLGYFTKVVTGDEPGSYKPGDFDAPTLEITKNTPKLSAWVRRAASKVTIAYNTSGLNKDVWIYINKVTIRDIPKTCFLGKKNTATSEEDLIRDGGVLYYDKNGFSAVEQSSKENWLTLTDKNQETVGSHSETTQALFFYENMQGDKEQEGLTGEQLKKFDKRHSNSPQHGVLVDPGDPDYKDEVPYGTYIEVEAFYDSQNPDNLTSGKIIYRFMLGKNVTYNYNAERNHHYKLTLYLKGWANQADWHIEYTMEEPSIKTPPVFYMPYLYNQQAMLPITLNGDVQSLKAEIIENGWSPVTRDTHQPPSTADYTWNEPALERFPPWQGTREVDGVEVTGYPQLGFLALAVHPEKDEETGQEFIPKNVVRLDYSTHETATNELKVYYEKQNNADGYIWAQNYREYDISKDGTIQDGFNGYVVKKAVTENYTTIQIPLWTRNKTMIENSGYTGNNPYEAFERKAVVKLTAEFKVNEDGIEKTKTLTQEVPVYQVRRIVNPKAVWRSSSDNESFLVHLMTLNSAKDEKYSPYESTGSWDASIESGDKTFCYLTKNASATSGLSKIEGGTGDEIKFYVKFNNTVTSGTSKGCIININYNGGSCTHKVLVRQGYGEAVPIVGESPLWSSYNLFSCEANHNMTSDQEIQSVVTMNPLALGTLFKRLNYSYGILSKNDSKFGPLQQLNGQPLEIAQKLSDGNWRTMQWANISCWYYGGPTTVPSPQHPWGTFSATPPRGDSSKIYRVPTYDEYKALDKAEYAVGIVYADGASVTDDEFTAYGFNDPENIIERSPMGVRGVIVYNSETGNQILFPLGEYGMARRIGLQGIAGSEANLGILRYGDTDYTLSSEANIWRPIPFNIPECPGAIYWINEPRAGGHADTRYTCGGWDMNYFSLDFSSYTNNNRIDACPIKLVTDHN